ncbi:MAG: hypothetical protein ABI333_02745 [bacterium]
MTGTAIVAAALFCVGGCVEGREDGGGEFEKQEELELVLTAHAKQAMCEYGIASLNGMQGFLEYYDAPPWGAEWDPLPVLECMAMADSCEALAACYECDVELLEAWCEGDEGVYCYGGIEVRESCAAFGATCGYNDLGLANCSVPCDTAGPYCEGPREMYCDGAEAGRVSDCSRLQEGQCGVRQGGEPQSYCYSSLETPCGGSDETHCDGGVVVGCSMGGSVQRTDCSQNTFRTWCAADTSGAYCTVPGSSHCEGTFACAGSTYSFCLGAYEVVIDCADYDSGCTDDPYLGPYCGTVPAP